MNHKLKQPVPFSPPTGGVQFSDDPPKLPAVKVTKDQDYCGETLPNETYVIESNGGLKNVVGKRRLSCRALVPDVIHSPRKQDSEWSRHGVIQAGRGAISQLQT